MDYLLIIVLGIVVVSFWNSSRDANERMREAVDRLEREIEFLRSQVAALMRAKPVESAALPIATIGASIGIAPSRDVIGASPAGDEPSGPEPPSGEPGELPARVEHAIRPAIAIRITRCT